MRMRAAVLTEHFGLEQTAFEAALIEALADFEVRTTLSRMRDAVSNAAWRVRLSWLAARLPFGVLGGLAGFRPDLVVSEAFGPKALQAALYRLLVRRSRLLLCATEPPRRYGLFERFVLGQADGVLAHGDDVMDAVELLRFPMSRIYSIATPPDIDMFAASPRHRDGADAHRLVYAGQLSPQSGAADFLVCVAAWAEHHADRAVEVWWIGEGDLSGVLEAQPLPDNMSQRFLGRLERRQTAAAFAECGILVVPPLAEGSLALVPEALAAGLVVLGSRRTGKVRQIVRDGVLGWTYDPLRPDDMLHALGRALESPADELDRMRDRGRALARSSAAESFTERVREAVAAVLPSAAAPVSAVTPL